VKGKERGKEGEGRSQLRAMVLFLPPRTAQVAAISFFSSQHSARLTTEIRREMRESTADAGLFPIPNVGCCRK
jgi:hypothetical protein